MVLGFADEMKKLSEHIAASYEARIRTVKDIANSTHSSLRNFHTTLNNFHKNRVHMSEEQRAELANFRKSLSGETKKIINKTHTMLNGFKSDFEKMAQDLHKMLSIYYKENIKKDVQDKLGSFNNEMKKLSAEFRQAHNAWMSSSRSIDAKRHIKQAPEKAPKAAAPRRTAKKRKTSRKK